MRTLLATRSFAALLLQSDQEAAHDLHTRLTGFLDILYVVAALLGIVLLVVAVAAVRVYIKNRNDKDLPS